MRDKMKLVLGAGSIFTLSEMAMRKNVWLWLGISIVIMFLVIAITPVCKRYESIWIFLLTIVLMIPVNIELTKAIMDIGLLELEGWVGEWMNRIEIYLPLLAIEELVMGVLGRLIWPRQYSLCVNA